MVYPSAVVNSQAGAVALQFDDGIGFKFIPAFLDTEGKGYVCPLDVAQGTWQLINPRAEIGAIESADVGSIKNLRRFCRILRVWKTFQNLPISPLLLDSFALDFISNWKYSDKSFAYYDWMCRDFFLYLKNQDPETHSWPAVGSEQLLPRAGEFESVAARCYVLAQEAIAHEHNKQGWLANQKWLVIFGERFLD